jgi:hypothetical protein
MEGQPDNVAPHSSSCSFDLLVLVRGAETEAAGASPMRRPEAEAVAVSASSRRRPPRRARGGLWRPRGQR